MSSRKKGLGRGLDSLLSAGAPAPSLEQVNESDLRQVGIDRIRRGPFQPRAQIQPEALQELADSIRSQGVVQPVVVRPVEDGFELVAGERRWRAAQMAGLQEIPAVVKTVPDQAAAAMALIENIQREDLNALEQATALDRLISEFGMTHQQAAEAVGRSRASVSNLLRLLELADEVKGLLREARLEMGHARSLLSLSGDQQVQAARKVTARGLSVRETERLVKAMLEAKPRPQSPAASRDPDVQRLEEDLGGRLGAKVAIQYNKQGKGKLVIQYNSLDELDGILAHIK